MRFKANDEWFLQGDAVKLLWFSYFIPYPPRGGNFQRSFNLLRQCSKKYEINLVALNQQAYAVQELKDYKQELNKYCATVEFWELPYRWRGAMWWLRLLWSPLWRTPFACRAVWSPRLAERWRRILQEHPGALLHYDSPDLGLFLPAPGFRKVLNHHNCESAMLERRAEAEPNFLKRAYLRMYAAKQTNLEREICGSFEVNVAVSELDAQMLQKKSPRAHFHLVENGTDTDYFHPMDTKEDPLSLIFAGSLDWHPNVSAVEFFVRDIWPLLKRQCPEAKLLLAGRNPAPSIRHAANADRNIVIGANPADIRPWMARGSVYICPILEGGGTRLKILDAMAMGKAIVSTSVGCEGLRARHGENILVADSPQDFVDAIMRLFSDEQLRRTLGNAGRALVEAHYSWQTVGARLEEAYRCALNPESCALRANESGIVNATRL